MILQSCDRPGSNRDPVMILFEERLDNLGYSFEQRDDGRYDVDFGGGQISTVSLDNKQKEFNRDQDPEIVYRFIDQIKRLNDQSNRTWEEVKPFLRYQLEPNSYEDFPDDTLFEPVAEGLLKIYVYVSPDVGLITWIADHMIDNWETDGETIKTIAERNMNALVAETTLEIEEIDGVPLGMLSTEVGPFKASMLLTSGLKELVLDRLGFPVYAVAPDREFVYLIPTEHTSFLGRLGPVVREQYEQSSYPISKKVFKIGAEGLSIAGTFEKRKEGEP